MHIMTKNKDMFPRNITQQSNHNHLLPTITSVVDKVILPLIVRPQRT